MQLQLGPTNFGQIQPYQPGNIAPREPLFALPDAAPLDVTDSYEPFDESTRFSFRSFGETNTFASREQAASQYLTVGRPSQLTGNYLDLVG